ncbi:replication initiation protein [Cetobacterium somerae]|uniref:replication initiation protein n=1 Tax=Cetobacterium somerae TaxID=188913 RepID=UPI003891E011
MGKQDIKYHNDMNLVSIGALNSSQIDILFSIGLTMAKDCSNKAIISFDEIKELSNYSTKDMKIFYRDLEGLFKKMLDLDFRIETETNIKRMNLFQYYDIQKDNGVVEIKANEIFLKLFDNMLRGNFTLFDLKDLVSLKSGYSKLMFKLLKGWNGKKKIDYTLEELYYLLGVPKSTQSIGNFTNKVMKPIKEELPKYFNKLEIEPIKTGRKITGYSFVWKPRASDIELIEDNIIHISEKLNRTIEKAKQNRFIKSFLTEEDIKKLLDKFNEEQLIKGLNHAYKEVQREISSLSYLIKAIETGAGKQDIKIVVKKNDSKESIEIVEVMENIGERTEQQIETKEVEYKKDLEGAKKFLFAKTISLKISNKVNIINNLKTLESAIEFGEKHGVDMSYFKAEEVVEELIEITQYEYEKMVLVKIFGRIADGEETLTLEEERKIFDEKNKHKYIFIDISDEILINSLKGTDITLEELREFFRATNRPTTNDEIYKFIQSFLKKEKKNETLLEIIGILMPELKIKLEKLQNN